MGRALVLAASLALLSGTSAAKGAERSLLAHKPHGGALHMVGLASATTYPYNQGLYQTNGNGTWYPGASVNSAFITASYAIGSTTNTYTPSVVGATPVSNNVYAGVKALAFPSQSLGVAVGMTSPGAVMPSILTTNDLGYTWQVVTGFYGAMPAGYALVNTAPDLNAVYCVARTLCVAVGGYTSNPNLNAYYYGPGGGVTTAAMALQTAGLLDTFGAIYLSTNGATGWTGISLPLTSALYAAASDASGKHWYAVGAPTAGTSNGTIASVATPNQPALVASILYSGDYGHTWITQSGPAINGVFYELGAVTVLRGTLAFAAGGSPWPSSVAAGGTGVIVGTANGGYSWNSQPISGNAANATFVQDIAFNLFGGNYTGWAVTSSGVVLKTSLYVKTLHNQAATYLNTPWTAKTLTLTSAVTKTQPLFGVTWDNNLVGYIYGTQTLMSTHDGGLTWYSEVPALAVLQSQSFVSIASVPTTY